MTTFSIKLQDIIVELWKLNLRSDEWDNELDGSVWNMGQSRQDLFTWLTLMTEVPVTWRLARTYKSQTTKQKTHPADGKYHVQFSSRCLNVHACDGAISQKASIQHRNSQCRAVLTLIQNKPQSLRLFLMMTSVTASKTNWMLLVSVAHVKCVYTSFESFCLFNSSNLYRMNADASS